MTIRIALDGLYFSMGRGGIYHYWLRLLTAIQHLQAELPKPVAELVIFVREDIHAATLKDLSSFEVVTIKPAGDFIWNLGSASEIANAFSDGVEASGQHFDYAMSTYYTLAEGLRNIGIVHDFIPESLGVWPSESPFWLGKKAYLRGCESFMFASHYTFHQARSYLPDEHQQLDQSLVLHPIIDSAFFSKSTGNETTNVKHMCLLAKSQGSMILIPGGSLSQEHKCTREAIYTAAEVLFSHGGGSIVVTSGVHSDQPTQAQQKRISELILKSFAVDVYFLNLVDLSALWELFKSASLIVCPSRMEGFGMPVAEALLVGATVVVRRHAGMEEAGGGLVHYFSDEGPTLKTLIRQLLRSPPPFNTDLCAWHLYTYSSTQVGTLFLKYVSQL
jgi:hypothetical protein